MPSFVNSTGSSPDEFYRFPHLYFDNGAPFFCKSDILPDLCDGLSRAIDDVVMRGSGEHIETVLKENVIDSTGMSFGLIPKS